jgi:hypothetical protein
VVYAYTAIHNKIQGTIYNGVIIYSKIMAPLLFKLAFLNAHAKKLPVKVPPFYDQRSLLLLLLSTYPMYNVANQTNTKISA